MFVGPQTAVGTYVPDQANQIFTGNLYPLQEHPFLVAVQGKQMDAFVNRLMVAYQ